MTSEEKSLETIRKLFHHEYNKEELRRLLKQFETEKEREAFYSAAEYIWKNTAEYKTQTPYNPEKLLQQILSAIRNKEDQPQKTVTNRFWVRKKTIQTFLKIAAVFILGILLFFGGRAVYLSQKKEVCINIKTPFGTKRSVILPDGTHVWLNAGSILKYPEYFEKTREIQLSGEAYFEVTKDPQHPFIVHTQQVNVKVLGTGFNVTAYKNEKVKVTLVHGRIMAFHENKAGKTEKMVILSPGEQTIFSKKTNAFLVREVNTNDYTVWKNGTLLFKDTPLNEVVQRINRWYNTQLVIHDPDLLQFDYSVEFHHDPLNRVLKVLAEMTPIQFTRSGKIIFITKDNTRWKKYLHIK